MRIRIACFCLTALTAMIAFAAAPGADAIHITAPSTQPADFTILQLKQLLAADIKPVQYTSKGAKHTFNCLPLSAVIGAAGVTTDFAMKPGSDPKTKNAPLRFAVIVRGRDGYTVVFSLAELLPMVSSHPVWFALDEDGQPLSDSDGPARLLVPDDAMPARSVHQIGSINVLDLGKQE